MAIWNKGKTQIKITLLAATLLTAVLLAMAFREPPPLETYTTPGGRELNCSLLYTNSQTAFASELRYNSDSKPDAARRTLHHVTRLYNGHGYDDRYAGYYPGNGAGPQDIPVTADDLIVAYRKCARGRK